ncbi:hypothetical protein N657DRAFT_675893 [Parathielavia appendiculata]|uniref:Dihydroxyacid dehydratase n=1 Tax=Parathielavia appendiculata TaxID=2587402 RepID=A0AAN6U7T3_9PEZI|nr:hypothetical protein N657DRAFT_675893 [Parathielavia appendiculata]
MAATHHETYDLLIVTDATASMGNFLYSLAKSIQDIIRITAITHAFSRIGVLAYRDYDVRRGELTLWSGWHSRNGPSEISQEQLLAFARNLTTEGGYSWPEAAKTGLALAYQHMRREAKTIILFYADAPPHTELGGDQWQQEREALLKLHSYGGTGYLFADWVSAANTLSNGKKQAQVFCIVSSKHSRDYALNPMYTFLSTRTGGACVTFTGTPSSTAISKVTIALLLAWMGAGKQGANQDTAEIVTQLNFEDDSGVGQLASEKDDNAARYLPVSRKPNDKEALDNSITRSPLSLETLAQVIPRREHPVMDFAARYKVDAEYQGIVVEQLTEIIESDVFAIALNPVFGALWRTVCNDRTNPARDRLITRFGLQVDREEDAEKKEQLKTWLEESYDWAGEIIDTIKVVPKEDRYPCVFLDPTVRFSQAEDGGYEENSSTKFTRAELLEIGRSCDYRILRRLGRILTHLTYVDSEDELPAHVRDVPEEEVARIPMALAKPKHQRKFWKILLHTVLPGTMLAARPAAVLAALSVRMGIKPLEEVAYMELLAWRDNWNTLDIPETWNNNCLSLLLEADKTHQLAMADAQPGATDGQTLLKAEDRSVFETLVSYKLLEMNLDTTLEAKVGWTPNKSKIPLGPLAFCKSCQYPRSVTIMADDGVCGMCVAPCECENKETHDGHFGTCVSKTDDSSTLATWTECSMIDCRAQYVVYHTGKLNVRPKCHYCRQKNRVSTTNSNYAALTTAPCVTCTTCANRILWPQAYRSVLFDASTFTCPACRTNTHATIVAVPTTARALSVENGTAFLLRNEDAAIPAPFTNRSLYHTISTASVPASDLPSKVTILPSLANSNNLTLTIRGKPLHNTPSLLASLSSWISSRRVQSGTCSLCFTPTRKLHLRLACGGRRGCAQPICGDCAQAWYGLNKPGNVINIAALSCPFCRRMPTNKVALPIGLRYLGGLRDAVEEVGEWVYAWCAGECGMARRFVDRICARGVPEVEGWRCEGCVDAGRRRGERKGDAGRLVVVKMCPACGVATEKVVGCDHISCVCGKHWCFNCGEMVADTAGEVYNHMSQVHRTWYADGEDEFGDYEDYTDEE